MTHAAASLTAASVRGTLRLLDAELYEEAIPFEGTAARLVSIADTVAQMIASRVGQLPEGPAHLLAEAVLATHRRDLLASRAFILDALAAVPPRRSGSRVPV